MNLLTEGGRGPGSDDALLSMQESPKGAEGPAVNPLAPRRTLRKTPPRHLVFLADRSVHQIKGCKDGAGRGGRGARAEFESAEVTVIAVDTEAITRPILEAIDTSKAELMGRIDHLSSECTLIRHDLDKIWGQLTTLEARFPDVEDTSHTQGAHLLKLPDLVRSLQHRADAADSGGTMSGWWGCRRELRGTSQFCLQSYYSNSYFLCKICPPTYVVERARRVCTGVRPPGAFPRSFLVRFLNYRDRDMILAQSKKHQELRHENARVMLFPFFSAATQQKRCSFNDIRKRLREKEIQYSMLYSSKLWV